MLRVQAATATDVGRRTNNEDAFLSLPDAGVFALADGMGGPPAGEVASAIFVESVVEAFGNAAPSSIDAAAALLKEAYRLAHRRLAEHVKRYPDHDGMGCTADLLVVGREQYLLGHLGDSRVYLYREGELRQLTRDHSLVQQLVDRGMISPLQARHHPMKNVLLRTLGAELEPVYDLSRGGVSPGDLFLLCSDGLTEKLDEEAIAKILSPEIPLPQTVATLMEEAKSAGGSDNVTVVLCRAESAATQ